MNRFLLCIGQSVFCLTVCRAFWLLGVVNWCFYVTVNVIIYSYLCDATYMWGWHEEKNWTTIELLCHKHFGPLGCPSNTDTEPFCQSSHDWNLHRTLGFELTILGHPSALSQDRTYLSNTLCHWSQIPFQLPFYDVHGETEDLFL